MNVTENINGVMGPSESRKTAIGNRGGHPSYPSTDGGKAPLGEHLAVSRSRFRVSHHGQERPRHA
jgi:hypothetical protein